MRVSDDLMSVARDSIERSIHQIFPTARKLVFESGPSDGEPRISKDRQDHLTVDMPILEGVVHAELSGKLLADQRYFTEAFLRIFDADLELLSGLERDEVELWKSLDGSRMSRAIDGYMGRYIGMKNWLDTVEEAAAMTYEGRSARYQILFAHDMPKGYAPALPERFEAEHLIRFERRKRLDFRRALLEEKWARRMVDGKRAAFVVAKGKVKGLLSLEGLTAEPETWVPLPHDSMRPVFTRMAPREVTALISEAGDIYLVRKNQDLENLPLTVFHRSQGKWCFLSYERVRRALKAEGRFGRGANGNGELADYLLQIALDLSFEKEGALFAMLEDRKALDALARDRRGKGSRPSAPLREVLSDRKKPQKGDPGAESEREATIIDLPRGLMVAAATVDGAVVLDREGHVLDVACMLAEPEGGDVGEDGSEERPSPPPGARSLAAWTASAYGFAIKVSEDGPISFWEGRERFEELGHGG